MDATTEVSAEKLNIINGSASVSEKEDPENISNQKTTKDGIILVPQPSDDPEEPLVRRIRNFCDAMA